MKADLQTLRATLGLSTGKAVAVLPNAKHLRNTSLEDNAKAADATITSISAGNAKDIARLAQQVREIALREPEVQLEFPGDYDRTTKPMLDRLVQRLDKLEATTPATKKNDEYLVARAKLDEALAKGPYGR